MSARPDPRALIMRHPFKSRLLHWSVAVSFLLALASGLAVYSPWLFDPLSAIFGGGALTRFLHPWFSLAFVVCFGLQIGNWFVLMRWTPADGRWLAHMREHTGGGSRLEAEDVGFFNGGQKVYFWAIVISAVVFFVSGLALWFPRGAGRLAATIAYVAHDLAALAMLGGFILHIYEATAAQPGTFQSMIRGTVERRWAWTHHPAWYRAETGRAPRADLEAATARERI